MRVITPPAAEPLTLAQVKEQLGIETSDTASDAVITRRIIEARQYAENYMQRALITQTQEIRLDCFPVSRYGEIKLPYPNLLTVVHIKYIDTNGDLQTIDPADYEADTYSFLGEVRPNYGTCWPTARQEKNAVRIQYTCGYGATYAAVPELLREALMLWVGHLLNFQPQAESGLSNVTRPPFFVANILDNYSVVECI